MRPASPRLILRYSHSPLESLVYFGTKELWRLGGWGAHSWSAPNGLPRPQAAHVPRSRHKGALSPG